MSGLSCEKGSTPLLLLYVALTRAFWEGQQQAICSLCRTRFAAAAAAAARKTRGTLSERLHFLLRKLYFLNDEAGLTRNRLATFIQHCFAKVLFCIAKAVELVTIGLYLSVFARKSFLFGVACILRTAYEVRSVRKKCFTFFTVRSMDRKNALRPVRRAKARSAPIVHPIYLLLIMLYTVPKVFNSKLFLKFSQT